MKDFSKLLEPLRSKLTEAKSAAYAKAMGVAPRSLLALGCALVDAGDIKRLKAGFRGGRQFGEALVMPEKDGAGSLVGFSLRALDATKGGAKDGSRGLVYSERIEQMTGVRLVVEGPGDAAAADTVNLPVIARASCSSGFELLATMKVAVEGDILIVAHNDEVGLNGARQLAQDLATKWNRPGRVARLPDGFKDIRDWLGRQDLDLEDQAACSAAGARLLELLQARVEEFQPQRLTTCFNDIESKDVEWLSPGFIPKGKLGMLVGHPGRGKSLVTAVCGAWLTNGVGMPGEQGPAGPIEVLYLSAEDDPADTMRPRLKAAGADLSRVHFSTSLDLRELPRMLDERPNVRLVVIDPLNSYVGDVDTHRDAPVRSFLAPFKMLAESRGVTILFIAHQRKAAGGPAVLSAGGSIGFIGAARFAWLVATDPDDKERRLMVPLKNNVGPDQLGWGFRISSDGPKSPPTIQWEAERVTTTADQLVSENTDKGPKRSAQAEAEEWLMAALADGPRSVGELEAGAAENDIALATLGRAKRKLNVDSEKDGLTGGWTWQLQTKEINSFKGLTMLRTQLLTSSKRITRAR